MRGSRVGSVRVGLVFSVVSRGTAATPPRPSPAHQRSLPACPPTTQKNFGRPVEYALVKDHAWSTPQLRKLDRPVDVEGNPWPLDAAGNPILK